jgi:hypothetical protein
VNGVIDEGLRLPPVSNVPSLQPRALEPRSKYAVQRTSGTAHSAKSANVRSPMRDRQQRVESRRGNEREGVDATPEIAESTSSLR